MPALTRRRYPERQDCWHIYFGDVHVGTIARRIGQPCDQEAWQWQCGFYPGSGPDEQRSGTGPSAPISRWRGRSSRPVARRPTTRHGAINGIGQLGNTLCGSAANVSRLKRLAREVRNQPPFCRSRKSCAQAPRNCQRDWSGPRRPHSYREYQRPISISRRWLPRRRWCWPRLCHRKGWLWRHESGTYVKFTQASADLFAWWHGPPRSMIQSRCRMLGKK